MEATSPAGADRLRTWLGSPDWLEGLVTAHPVAAEGLARLTDAANRRGFVAGLDQVALHGSHRSRQAGRRLELRLPRAGVSQQA